MIGSRFINKYNIYIYIYIYIYMMITIIKYGLLFTKIGPPLRLNISTKTMLYLYPCLNICMCHHMITFTCTYIIPTYISLVLQENNNTIII